MNENVVNLAASALTSWKAFNGKHMLEGQDNSGGNPMKRARNDGTMGWAMTGTNPMTKRVSLDGSTPGVSVPDPMASLKPELKPYPFFYYRDFSTQEDPDPLTPLTFPGRVPNFPAKLHAILSQPDLAEVIDWLPHGRSWRVLKPREFEMKIIPKFFEHSKFSSFVRQANGWGFRRITQGPDRNSYYHEKFLRGLPHLCKTMKRPGVSEKRIVDPDLEPDFYKISQIHPVPHSADEESIFLQKTLQSGPKSRMPIVTTAFNSSGRARSPSEVSDDSKPSATPPSAQPSHTPGASAENHVNHVSPATSSPSLSPVNPVPAVESVPVEPNATATQVQAPILLPANFSDVVGQTYQMSHSQAPQPAPAAALDMVTPEQHPKLADISNVNQMTFQFPTLDPNSSSSFAAGFAAATAHYQQHFFSMLNNMAATKQLPDGFTPQSVMNTAQPASTQ